MISLALDPAYRRVSVAEFLANGFRRGEGGTGKRPHLHDGGGNEAHARIASNVIAFLRPALRGSGCRPYGSDFAVRTGSDTVRFPDVSIYRRDFTHADDGRQLLGDPGVVFEVLSPSTASHDQKVKLAEYLDLAGLDELVFVDPQTERVRHIRRTGPEGWADDWLPAGADLTLGSIGATLPHAEIFARD